MTKKIIKSVLIIFCVLMGIIGWGLLEPYTIDVEEENAQIDNLPDEWEGEKIAVLGDFQVGMWWDNTSTIKRMVDGLLEDEPAAVLLTGDFVYHAAKDKEDAVKDILDILRPLGESDIPVFAVLGNHDYALSNRQSNPNEELAQKVSEGLESMNIEVLQNESTVLKNSENTEELYIAGIGSSWADKANPSEAMAEVPEEAPRIVLMHNPDTFDRITADRASLAVAGHTHGGQMSLSFLEDWSYMALVQSGEVHADGWINDYGAADNQLYVNRGIGFSTLPLRIFCPPELTLFTLKAD